MRLFKRTKKKTGKNTAANNTQVSNLIIVDEQVVSVSDLHSTFKTASTKFWSLLISFILLGMMVVPYMSNAATMSSSATSVFDGNVIPGYSMGGVTLTAYGVDLNEWAKPSDSSGTVVRTNYGIWNVNTVTTTKASALGASVDTNVSDDDSDQLDSDERSEGWKLLTGRTNYSLSYPNGQNTGTNNSNSSDSVAPYRTVADYNFWNTKTPSSDSNASADIDVSLYADFIIVSLDGNNLSLISNPDDVTSSGTGVTEGTTAEPYYISLKDMLSAYGLSSTTASASDAATMDNLIAAVEADGGQKIVEGITGGTITSLLDGTYYNTNNSDVAAPVDSTQAFNPYPYTMVFSGTDSSGNIVVSSMYENSEAYVFFSPASVYSKYTTLRSEYDDYISGLTDAQLSNAGVIFQLGYYAATLAILEAYLDEALPQDATRGYVGPTETTSLYQTNAGELNISQVQSVLGTSSFGSPSAFQSVLYGTLMYDVAKTVINSNTTTGEEYEFGKTNAIMDLLSTFGYNNSLMITTGVMKGMPRDYVYARTTSLTVTYKSTAEASNLVNDVNVMSNDDGTVPSVQAGMYTPVYYPIQQHVMPESEKTYRFQILSAIPYETLVALIGENGLSGDVALSYSSSLDDLGINLSTLTDITSSLVSQLSNGFEEDTGYDLDYYDENNSIICNSADYDADAAPEEDSDEAIVQERVDSALLNYANSTMTNDNVHDLVDIVRATNMLKVETWNRFYNPLKGSGGDNDIFITRVSPANTTYMPSILFNGYTPAGGSDIVSTPYSQSFDYFSIPSFAACFASHTASTSYYGSLSYEIRAFYLSGFLETLSDSVNLPVLEQYNEAVSEAEETAANAEENLEISKADILLFYVLIKRLSATQTLIELDDNIDDDYIITLSGSKIRSWLKKENIGYSGDRNDNDKGKNFENEDDAEGAVNYWFLHSTSDNAGTNDDKKDEVQEAIDAGEDIEIYALDGNSQIITKGNWWTQMTKSVAIVFTASWNDSFLTSVLGSHVVSVADSSDTNTVAFIRDQMSNTGYTQKEDQIGIGIFSYLYEYWFDFYTGEGGDYYWSFTDSEEYDDAWDAMRAFLGKNDDGEDIRWTEIENELSDEVKEVAVYVDSNDNEVTITPYDGSKTGGERSAEDLYKYAVVFDGMKSAIFGIGMADIEDYTDIDLIGTYETGIDTCFRELTQGISNIYNDIAAIIASMPSQMMNCIAWADYMNATDSEAQYSTDPTDANVTIIVADTSSSTSDSTDYITSESQAEALGVDVSYDDDGIILTSSGELTDEQVSAMSSDSRLVRGVEGATSTATITPAVYTISATIGRISTLAANSGTQYPYYGIANGRLESGADRYAQIQAHTVDYSSIASGLSDLNTNRVQPNLVVVTQEEYGGWIDFTSILSKLGAMLAELGTSILSGAANMFSSVFFDTDSSSSTSSSSSANAATLLAWVTGGSSTESAMPTLNGQYTFDGITMTRTSAAAASFDTSTSTLAYNTSTPTASAIGLENWAQSFIVGSGYSFYSLIQSIALVIVMLSLLIIAFRNFYAYTISTKGDDIINAQTQLKVVLPRSIIAIFMIGLPVTSDTGIGFQGGCYLLLQLLSSIISYVAQIFMGLNGTGVMSMWTSIDVSQLGSDIAAYIIFFFACLVLAVMFVLGVVAVFLQSIMLAAFYFIGPIVWSFYVWPFSSPDDVPAGGGEGAAGSASETANGFLGTWTKKMTFGQLTNGKVGNQAPAGWVAGYMGAAMLTIAWCLIFWVVSMVFLGTSGVLTSSSTASAASISTALAATAGTTTLFDNAWANVLFATFIAVLLFLIMFRSAINMFKGVGFNSFNVARSIGRAAGQLVARQAKNRISQPLNNLSNRANEKLFAKQLAAARERGDYKAIERIQKRRDAFTNWTTLDGTDGSNGVGTQLKRVGDGLARTSQQIRKTAAPLAAGDIDGLLNDAQASAASLGKKLQHKMNAVPWYKLLLAAKNKNLDEYRQVYNSLSPKKQEEIDAAGLMPPLEASGFTNKFIDALQKKVNDADKAAAALDAGEDVGETKIEATGIPGVDVVSEIKKLEALPDEDQRKKAYNKLDADTQRTLSAYGLRGLSDDNLRAALETAEISRTRQGGRVNSLAAQQNTTAERSVEESNKSGTNSSNAGGANNNENSLIQKTIKETLESIREADNAHRGEMFNRLGEDMRNVLSALGVNASTLGNDSILANAVTNAASLGDVAMTANEAAQRTQLEAGRIAADYGLSMADATNIVRSQANAATRLAVNTALDANGNYVVGNQTQYMNALAQNGAALAAQYSALAASTSTDEAHAKLVREQCSALGGNVISSTQAASIASLGGGATAEQLEQLKQRNEVDARAAGIAANIKSGAALSANDKAFYEAYQTMLSFEQANGANAVASAASVVSNAVNNLQSLSSNAIDATAKTFLDAYETNRAATQSIVNEFMGNAALVGAVANNLVSGLGFNDEGASKEAYALAAQIQNASSSGALTSFDDIGSIVDAVASSSSDPRIKSLASELQSMTRDGVTGNGILAESITSVAAAENLGECLKRCQEAAQNNVVELVNQYVRDAQASSMMSLGTTDPAAARKIVDSVGDSGKADLLASFAVSGAIPSSVIADAASGSEAALNEFSSNYSTVMSNYRVQKSAINTKTKSLISSLNAAGVNVGGVSVDGMMDRNFMFTLDKKMKSQRSSLEKELKTLRQQVKSGSSGGVSDDVRRKMQVTSTKLKSLDKAEREVEALSKLSKQFERTRNTASAYNQAGSILRG